VKEGLQKATESPRRQPCHLPDQRKYIQDLFDTDKQVWMLFMDAGRYDIFDQLVWDYFDGQLERVWNGGVGYTGDWADRNLRMKFGNRGLLSQLPLRYLQGVEYDGRDYFAMAPDISAESGVSERLAALGYTDGRMDRTFGTSPFDVNVVVRQEQDSLNGGVIRYLKPHPPFEGMEEMTSQSSKTAETQAALDSGELSYQELTDAYIQTYETAFEAAAELVPDIDGKVILTADHGTCLTCGQLFHGRQLDMHDHLTHVPWFEVDRTV
jgi:hypothetical protein